MAQPEVALVKVLVRRTPYREVYQDDVVVSHLSRSPLGGQEAWGYLRSEMRVDIDVPLRVPAVERKPGLPEPGESYRVAYTDDQGRWCAEGVTRYQVPPDPVMRQIIQLEIEAARGAARG